MDFRQFEMTQDAVFLQLNHPKTGEPMFELGEDGKPNKEQPIGVRIFSADSEVFKRHQRRLQNESIENLQKKRQLTTAEKLEDESLNTLAACIAEIRGISWGDKPLESPADNRNLLEWFPWAKDQINTAMADRTRFMPALAQK
jgi:hypothetical protein